MEYVELGGACDDCTIVIANNDYTGMSDSQAEQTREGLARVGLSLIVGSDYGFRDTACVVCRRRSGGNKTEVGYLVPLVLSVSRIRINGGGYDRRGGYWGVGLPIYHVVSDYDSVNFQLRAEDRTEALAEVSRRCPGASFHRGVGRPRSVAPSAPSAFSATELTALRRMGSNGTV
jgi:hypothetical protein